MSSLTPFKKPIYVSRPIFPKISEIIDKLKEIWDSKWITNYGRQHTILEDRIKKLLKVPYISLFNNGTIALLTALKSLNLKGEVITTPFTFPATVHSLTWSNLLPVFCDIDENTLTINPKKIESLITKKTSAILGVHVFGIPCDVSKIQQIAKKYKLKVIYDAAHAFGTEINGNAIGNFGDITMFSFHATKLFHTAEGGALTYSHKNLKTRIDLMKNFGIKNEDEVVLAGINGKMNELQAALGLVLLNYIKVERNKRRKVKKLYQMYLKRIKGINYLKDFPNITSSEQYFVIIVEEKIFGRSRDYIYQKFKEFNIYARKYFYPLCSSFEHYRNLPSSRPKNVPVATNIANKVLSMPFYGDLTSQEIEKICSILESFK